MSGQPPLIALSLLLGAGLPSAAQEKSALTHQPRGAVATGTVSSRKVPLAGPGSRYYFRFEGSETIEYEIDTSASPVRQGLLHVRETTTDSLPLEVGGLGWRNFSGDIETPLFHSTQAQVELYHEFYDEQNRMLELKYREERNGVVTHKTYEFRLVGKVLKVRAYADPTHTAYLDNYARFEPGPSERTLDPVEQHVPFMDNAVVVQFDLPGGGSAFYSLYLDYYASNGVGLPNEVVIPPSYPPIDTGETEQDSYEHFYSLTSRRGTGLTSHPFTILQPVDDTLNLIVTSQIEETFPIPSHYRSPYYLLTSGRMTLRGTSNALDVWDKYRQLYDDMSSWGMADMVIHQYQSRKWGSDIMTPENDSPFVLGCDETSIRAANNCPPTGLCVVDPDAPANIALANNQFGLMAASVRSLGALFASTVAHAASDQWGSGEYTLGSPYPNIPLGHNTNKWGSFQIDFPSSNPAYDSSKVVRRFDGTLTPGWDTSNNTNNTTWAGTGYKTATVDFEYLFDHLKGQLENGKALHGANATLFDASSKIPQESEIDQMPGSTPMTHSTGAALRKHAATLRALRGWMEGPIYGEETHWRRLQGYEHGIRDGIRQGFPTDDDDQCTGVGGSGCPTEDNHESWVIPDFNLREALAKSGGHAGIGAENIHQTDNLTPPYDRPDGQEHDFLDSYLNTTVTYGNNPFVTSNGKVNNNYWASQGVIRSYFTVAGLSRRMREETVQQITYVDLQNSSIERSLSEAVKEGVDLKRPRVKVQFSSGLVLYANHDSVETPVFDGTAVTWDVTAGSNWTVQIPKLSGGLETVELQPNGFAASDGTSIFLFHNARPSGSNVPFDYVRVENRWEMLTNRVALGSSSSGYDGSFYDGFPTLELGLLPTPQEWTLGTIVRNDLVGRAIGAKGFSTATADMNPTPPTPVHLQLETEAAVLHSGKPEGFVAKLYYDNGSWRDVTPDVDWSQSIGVSVNGTGAALADPAFSLASVIGDYTPAGFSSPFTARYPISIADGTPVASGQATSSFYPGEVVLLDGTASQDPKGNYMHGDWLFGDGAQGEGLGLPHVYHSTGSYAAQLNVYDIEENSDSTSVNVSISADDANTWADSFDDGTLDGWLASGVGPWGSDGLAIRQSQAAGYAQLEVDSGLAPVASYGVRVRLDSGGRAGLRASFSGAQSPLNSSGLSIDLQPNGKLTLCYEGGSCIGPIVPNFDASRWHDLHVVVRRRPGGSAQNPLTVVRVFLDGQYVTQGIFPPVAGTRAGLFTENMTASFDAFIVTNWKTPYSSVYPMDLDSDNDTKLVFSANDEDGAATIDLSQLTLTVRFANGTQQVFSGQGRDRVDLDRVGDSGEPGQALVPTDRQRGNLDGFGRHGRLRARCGRRQRLGQSALLPLRALSERLSRAGRSDRWIGRPALRECVLSWSLVQLASEIATLIPSCCYVRRRASLCRSRASKNCWMRHGSACSLRAIWTTTSCSRSAALEAATAAPRMLRD